MLFIPRNPQLFALLIYRCAEVVIGFNGALEKQMQRTQQENKPPHPRTFDKASALLLELL